MGSGGGGGGGGDEEQTQLQTLDQLLRSVLPDGGDHPFPRRGANSGGGAPCRRTAEGEWKNRQRRRERSRDQSRPKQRAVEGMTLEDFLSMEVVTGENPEKNSAQRRRQRAEQNVAAAAAAAAYSQSCTSPEPLVMGPGEMVERTVERRQKRMMKNRESAARSRARKQVGPPFSCSYLLRLLPLSDLQLLLVHRPTPTSWRTRFRAWKKRTRD